MNNDSPSIRFAVQQRNRQELDPAPADGREGALEPPPDASYSNSWPLPQPQNAGRATRVILHEDKGWDSSAKGR